MRFGAVPDLSPRAVACIRPYRTSGLEPTRVVAVDASWSGPLLVMLSDLWVGGPLGARRRRSGSRGSRLPLIGAEALWPLLAQRILVVCASLPAQISCGDRRFVE